jgi:hypothetical protein
VSERIEEQRQCRAGCVVKGTEENDEPSPMLATHGAYCDRCFSRLAYPLRLAPDLAEHVTSRIPDRGNGGDESLVKTSNASAPMPFNEGAFADVNGMYETLVYLARYFAKRLQLTAPEAASHAWRSEAGHVKGLPSNVTPSAARYQTAAIATWLDSHLNDILTVLDTDDLEGVTGLLSSIAAVGARHSMKMRSHYSPMPHQTEYCDQGKIALWPPRRAGDRRLIICEGCGNTFSETWYLSLLRDWRDDILAARRKANRDKAAAARRTAEHLAAKYAGDLMLTAPALTVSSARRQREYDLIRDALAEAADDIPPAGVLVRHDDGATSITVTHTVKPGKVRHIYETANGHLAAPDVRIGEH